MEPQLTIVIPNRNRDLRIVKRTLDSIVCQIKKGVSLFLVDYGSKKEYQVNLEALLTSYSNIQLILCPTQGQLWNKSRCINIVLKQVQSKYIMVSDMDMIWYPDFLKDQLLEWKTDAVTYYKVGFLSEQESSKSISFKEYAVNFYSSEEATGISVFPREILMEIQGFDEFYHGWGSEDSDAHARILNAGYHVNFVGEKCYFKHQWHEKGYRSQISDYPFHPHLERINFEYFLLSRKHKIIKVNNEQPWGIMPEDRLYHIPQEASIKLNVEATKESLKGLLFHLHQLPKEIKIIASITIKQGGVVDRIKGTFSNAKINYLSLEELNVILLEEIISNYRNDPYNYSFDKAEGRVEFMFSKNTAG